MKSSVRSLPKFFIINNERTVVVTRADADIGEILKYSPKKRAKLEKAAPAKKKLKIAEVEAKISDLIYA